MEIFFSEANQATEDHQPNRGRVFGKDEHVFEQNPELMLNPGNHKSYLRSPADLSFQ